MNNFLGGIFGKVVENAEGILDEVLTTKEERETIKLELKKILLEAEREAFSREVEDRKDARSLYKDDALIQKILAAVFTVGYFALSYIMFKYFVLHDVVLSEYEIGFISTIVDFFFGGSSKDNK